MEVVVLLILAEFLFFSLLFSIAFLPALGRQRGYGVSVICSPCKDGAHDQCDHHYWSPTSGRDSCPCQHKTRKLDLQATEPATEFLAPSPNGQYRLF